jgi:hypothetical protein
MAINLRIDLRLARDATLTRRYEEALTTLERLVPPRPAPAKTWFGRALQWRNPLEHFELLQRTFLRHPWFYRLKVRALTVLHILGALDIPGVFYVVLTLGLWLLAKQKGVWRDEVAAYLARCEFEDITDELERRMRRRKARHDRHS